MVNYAAATASDNAPGVTVSCTPPSGSFFPVGTTTLTCTATDAAGNTATATFTITVSIDAGDGNNSISVSEDGSGNIIVVIDSVTVLNVPRTSLTSLIINGQGGNDSLTLDFTAAGGVFDLPIIFNGGVGPADNDALVVTGGTFTTVTHTFTSTGPEHSGDIAYNTGAATATVSYTGLEPVDMSGSTITDLVFNLPAGANSDAFLEDDGVAGNNMSRLRSNNATFEDTTFTNPTDSLTINAGMGDTVSIALVDTFTGANLTVATPDNINVASIVGGGVVTLTTSGAIRDVDGAAVDDIDISATSVACSASTGIGITDALGTGGAIETQVSNLEAVTMSGGVFVANADTDLTIGGVNLALTGV